ncbi:hypothetical protein [Dongia rigui]|uniref:Helix-turn-helix domain-containing protein n=1 Tax=Dongia rigui TaxID=940149 RepID=A0ABU5E0J8_9PROT|nr:hypothetical protein [Dongia rigui]MDY0873111.1 hypothetical protein [Dongia rigui]
MPDSRALIEAKLRAEILEQEMATVIAPEGRDAVSEKDAATLCRLSIKTLQNRRTQLDELLRTFRRGRYRYVRISSIVEFIGRNTEQE